jgi:hypothetical protein
LHPMHGSVCTAPSFAPNRGKQELDLFEFAATSVAETGAATTKIVRCQMVNAGSLRTPFDRIPHNVGSYASVPSRSILQNASEHSPLAHPEWRQTSTSPLHHVGMEVPWIDQNTILQQEGTPGLVTGEGTSLPLARPLSAVKDRN